MKKLLICLTLMTTLMTTTTFANTFEQSKDDLYNTYNEAIEKTMMNEKLSMNMSAESVYENMNTVQSILYFGYLNSMYNEGDISGKMLISYYQDEDYYRSYSQYYLKDNKLYKLNEYQDEALKFDFTRLDEYEDDSAKVAKVTDAQIKDSFKTLFPEFKKEDIINSSYKKQGDNYLMTFELKSVDSPYNIYLGSKNADLFNYKNDLNVLVDKDLNIIKYDFAFETYADVNALTAYTMGEKLLFEEENLDIETFEEVYKTLKLTTTGDVYFSTKNDFKLVFPKYIDEISPNN